MKTITIEELEALKDAEDDRGHPPAGSVYARNFSGGGKPPGVTAGRAI